MDIEFDPAKNEANIVKHGLSFTDFNGFDAEPTVIEDDRYNYGETRLVAFGRIDGEARSLVFTMRGGAVRIISFRPAHIEEMSRYE